MITIEEKLNLFTKLIYDKIEKENESLLKKFNLEYGNLLDEKKKEFQKQAEQLRKENEKDIEKQKLQIISKAKIEEKKIILEKRKEIFDEVLDSLIVYCKNFTNNDEYKDMLLNDLNKVLKEMDSINNFEITITYKDYKRYKDVILNMFNDKNIEFNEDDDLLGGFIITDKEKNIRIDMSMKNRILNSKEIIGEKLFEALQ
ncbi:V/A-type H+-transporting ATPase subunit E [Caloramator quimbayensis]|uniref:V/A-type H+-transporting ATPase subunit E n=1 Tax=Caloramator quimbayensis TaxID=1147123 RepID=A0A1T4XLX9_9CLOT|nr:V-type ATP synthase subunit E [Caloramator quimbayensis]SKA90537.1 V/A-type H+-transporting ATPase subunit E [Caloramator quimbayensis]